MRSNRITAIVKVLVLGLLFPILAGCQRTPPDPWASVPKDISKEIDVPPLSFQSIVEEYREPAIKNHLYKDLGWFIDKNPSPSDRLPDDMAFKWKQPIRIPIEWQPFFAEAVAEINAANILPHPISFTEDDEAANLRVLPMISLWKCPSTFDVIETGYAIPVKTGTNYYREGFFNILNDPENKTVSFEHIYKPLYCEIFAGNFQDFDPARAIPFTIWYPRTPNIEGFIEVKDDGEIYRATCIINNSWPEKERRWATTECLARSSGFIKIIAQCTKGVLGYRLPGQALPPYQGLQPCDLAALSAHVAEQAN